VPAKIRREPHMTQVNVGILSRNDVRRGLWRDAECLLWALEEPPVRRTGLRPASVSLFAVGAYRTLYHEPITARAVATQAPCAVAGCGAAGDARPGGGSALAGDDPLRPLPAGGLRPRSAAGRARRLCPQSGRGAPARRQQPLGACRPQVWL